MALGSVFEEGDEVVHEGEFGDAAGFPVQSEGLHEVGEFFAVEEEALEFAIGQIHAVERLEFLPEVLLQSRPISDVGADGVFQAAEFFNEFCFDVLFFEDRGQGLGIYVVGNS